MTFRAFLALVLGGLTLLTLALTAIFLLLLRRNRTK
jgi:hypothetical protein